MTGRNRELKIRIISKEQAGQDIIRTLEDRSSGKTGKGLYFRNLNVVRKILTEKRLEILKIVKEKEPGSIYELSKILGRDFKNVYTDLKILRKYGLIELTKRSNVTEILVPYETITVSMDV